MSYETIGAHLEVDGELPLEARNGYSLMASVLFRNFWDRKHSGTATVHFKEGIPMTVEPSPRISLKLK